MEWWWGIINENVLKKFDFTIILYYIFIVIKK